jgi:hypothetical protein
MTTRIKLALTFAIAMAACGGTNGPSKGSSAKGSDAAAAGQKAGGTAEGDMSMATSDGSSFDDATCDDSDEGVAWCDDDTTIVFCSGGSFYSLDCGSIGGDFCAELDDTVDCYAIQ